MPKFLDMRASAAVLTRPVSPKQEKGLTLEVVRHSAPASLHRVVPANAEPADTGLVSDRLEEKADSDRVIRQQLNLILQSSMFIHSCRLSRFLRFIVEHAIAGNQDYLKEYVIGSEVYDRRPPYHPSLDSIVRSEARRLRGKLKEYYASEGKDDPVYVYLRPGSYIPVFQSNTTLLGTEGSCEADHELASAKSSVITIAIFPFEDLSSTPLSSDYAHGIPDEVAYTLMKTEEYRVMSPGSMTHPYMHQCDVVAMMSKAGARIAVGGSVKTQGNQIRITARIVDAAGFQLWTMRFDTAADLQTVFATEEEVAAALSVGLGALFGTSRFSNPA